MDFKDSKKFLLDLFQGNNFEQHMRNNRDHAVTKIVDKCSNGTKITIAFPGYKAKIKNGRIVYDYRVGIKKEDFTTSLSHVNIIVDIYNKCKNTDISIEDLRNKLIQQSQETLFSQHILEQLVEELPYTPQKPPQDLLDYVELAYQGVEKLKNSYNRSGNNWDLTIEELFKSIKWIVIQEDINYPISDGYEGRRMSFLVY